MFTERQCMLLEAQSQAVPLFHVVAQGYNLNQSPAVWNVGGYETEKGHRD